MQDREDGGLQKNLMFYVDIFIGWNDRRHTTASEAFRNCIRHSSHGRLLRSRHGHGISLDHRRTVTGIYAHLILWEIVVIVLLKHAQ